MAIAGETVTDGGAAASAAGVTDANKTDILGGGDAPKEGADAPKTPDPNETPEAKTAREAAEKAAADKKTKDDAKAAAGAPEKYEAFTLPEGFTLPEAEAKEFDAVARGLNLPQDKAQQLLDAFVKREAQKVQGISDFWNKQSADWAEASKTDKEFGGEKFKENAALANKALDAFGTKELRAVLSTYGLSNNPEVIRAFYRVGKTIGEDKLVVGGGPGKGADVSAPEAMYPSMYPKK